MAKNRGCNLCNTDKCLKHDEIEMLKADKARIIRATDKNKKYYRSIVKTLLIACGILVVELIFTLAFGKDGILLAIDLIKGIFIK